MFSNSQRTEVANLGREYCRSSDTRAPSELIFDPASPADPPKVDEPAGYCRGELLAHGPARELLMDPAGLARLFMSNL